MNHPLINRKGNNKEEMISLKSMTQTVSMRMGMTTPTMDKLELKFNFQMVQGNHSSVNY